MYYKIRIDEQIFKNNFTVPKYVFDTGILFYVRYIMGGGGHETGVSYIHIYVFVFICYL